MPDHPYGWLSLLPPMAAIVLAIITRRVVLSLLLGLFVGALVTSAGNPIAAVGDTVEIHLWNTLVQEGKLRVMSFTVLMAAMIGVIDRTGGMQALISLVSPWARNRQRGQLTTWMLGLVIFFDDYANTILLGNTLRPLCDRLRISREKLAYIVDSTAAPVAGLALLSTWVAVEIEYVQLGLNELNTNHGLGAFALFVNSLPYRFYVIMALLFVPMTALLGRDFGPMLQAERRRLRSDKPDEKHLLLTPETTGDDLGHRNGRWYNAVIPLAITIVVVMWFIYATGTDAVANRLRVEQVDSTSSDGASRWQYVFDVFGESDSAASMQRGALSGLVVAGLLAMIIQRMTLQQVVQAAGAGAKVVLPALAILWLASSMSRMTGSKSYEDQKPSQPYEFASHRLYTGEYLQAKITGQMPGTASSDATEDHAKARAETLRKLLPTIVFVLSGFVAFCTGTSWGTMGILLPMTVNSTYTVLSITQGVVAPSDPILLCTIGGVLAGAVFGDHCSPISDTTVLSSQASGCDHIAHVITQLPYAMAVAAIAVVLGTLPIGWGVSVWVAGPLQVVTLWVLLRMVGGKVQQETLDANNHP